MNQCSTTAALDKSFGCSELWAGNERAHRSMTFAGLEASIIARPSGHRAGGDLCALFSCGDAHARVVIADCVGHGYAASLVAAHVHDLLHKVRDHRNSSRLLEALNNEFTLSGQLSGGPLRLTTLVTAIFDRATGEFNYAYAAHPRMLLWRKTDSRWTEIGEGLSGLPIGFIAGEAYSEQSIRMEDGDVVLAFSDGITDVFSLSDQQLGPGGVLEMAKETCQEMLQPFDLGTLVRTLVEKIESFRGSRAFDDDFTLMAFRRLPAHRPL